MPDSSHPAGATKPGLSWIRLLLPSLADIIFLSLFYALSFGPLAPVLLRDADIGWHIRNGEHIWQTFQIPRADYFSYTRFGQPWYAWEWLYDLIIGRVHAAMGLNGVVLFSALIIAATFTLLFRLTLARSGNLFLAAGLALLSAEASTLHMLGRPHLLTWLLTVIWYQLLDQFQTGKRKNLAWLPLLMLFWVNLHGGFLLGLALLALYGGANLWTYVTAAGAERRQVARRLGAHQAKIAVLCLLATLATPYSYKLHLHLYQYLSNRFLMDNIDEFLSPNFHTLAVKFFAILLLVALLGCVLAPRKPRAVDLLIIAFSTYAALYAARNIPIAALLLSLSVAASLGESLRRAAAADDLSAAVRRPFSFFHRFSERMGPLEFRFNASFLPILLVLASVGMALNGGRFLGNPVLTAQFDGQRFPVQATRFLRSQEIHDRLFSTDVWSGYLMYQLHPRFRVFVDDRHDFYGEAFLREYLKVVRLSPGWREVLDAYRVDWILVSPESALANALKEMPDWKMAYADDVAVLYARTAPHPPAPR